MALQDRDHRGGDVVAYCFRDLANTAPPGFQVLRGKPCSSDGWPLPRAHTVRQGSSRMR